MISAKAATVPMRDGVRLAADVAHSNDRAPAVLVRSPYGRAGLRTRYDIVGLVRAGWSVVLSDVRGTGDSDGEFRPFHQEIADGYDTVDWVARQPWCDGRIVMRGGSYPGAAQWLAAMSGHQALAAVAPLMTTASYRDGWCSENGVATAGFLRAWALRFATTTGELPPEHHDRAIELYDMMRHDSAHNGATLGWHDDEIGDLFPPFREWMATGSNSLDAVDALASGRLAVPARQTGGWYDIFIEGGLRAFAELATQLDPTVAPQRMVVGPWSHATTGAAVVGNTNFGAGADAERLRLDPREMDWLAAAIDPDRRRELGHRLSVFVLGRGDWIDLDSWPPSGTRSERWGLGADGSIGLPGDAAPADGTRRILHDPNRVLAGRGGRMFGFWPPAGPADVGPIDEPYEIAYLSAPLERDTLITGRIGVELFLTAGDDDTVVNIRVDRMSASGAELLLTEQAATVSPGANTLDAGSTAAALGSGDRLRVLISLSNTPRLAHPPTAAAIDIGHDGRTHLVIPVNGANRA